MRQTLASVVNYEYYFVYFNKKRVQLKQFSDFFICHFIYQNVDQNETITAIERSFLFKFNNATHKVSVCRISQEKHKSVISFEIPDASSCSESSQNRCKDFKFE